MNGNTNPVPMEQEYKIIYRDESGTKGSVSLPSFLIENRKELWRAAFRGATLRLQQELGDAPVEQLLLRYKELSAKHKVYFAEYLDNKPPIYDLVLNSELAWATSLDEAILKRLGNGDKEVGIEELFVAICQIADDELDPILREYCRSGPTL
jgi:hypothetical protein